MHPVLIVDDEKDNLEALRRLLRNQYEVTTTQSPFEALKLLQKNRYHVIVSDERMPEMRGVELLEKAKNVSPATTRILLTGYTDVESVIGAVNRGHIYRYVAKPWDPEELKLTLRQANEAFLLLSRIEDQNQELIRGNQELQKANAELLLLDRAKARFLSLVSHELNTPLTVLSSFLSLIVEKKGEFSGEIQKAVASLESASQRFSQIVAEVLTYTRLESENRLSLQTFDLEKETKVLARELADALSEKKLTLSIKGATVPDFRCDVEKMRVALRKFLQDAIIRSSPGSPLEIVMAVEEGKVCYTLWRSGEVVSEDAFKPLEMVSDPLRHHRNLGLGLAICKLIVEGHGGELRLDSSDENGTLLTLLLPLPAGK